MDDLEGWDEVPPEKGNLIHAWRPKTGEHFVVVEGPRGVKYPAKLRIFVDHRPRPGDAVWEGEAGDLLSFTKCQTERISPEARVRVVVAE